MRKTCLNKVYELAKKDERVVYIGSDPGAGTLDEMKREMPNRFFVEGICEQNVIGMAAGLAMEGFIPYVNTIATFITRRCFEQNAIDVCLHNLPIRLIGNGGGMVYAPLGPTHTAIEDISIMRSLPNMSVVCPTDAKEMDRFMDKTLDWKSPIYIRLGKGGDEIVSSEDDNFEIGKALVRKKAGDVVIFTTGIMASRALKAADILEKSGISCGVVNMHSVKPFDDECLYEQTKNAKLVVSAEEHSSIGGLGSAILESFSNRITTPIPPVLRLSMGDNFTHNYGSQDNILQKYGLQPKEMAEKIAKTYSSLRG
jgi:transketolase